MSNNMPPINSIKFHDIYTCIPPFVFVNVLFVLLLLPLLLSSNRVHAFFDSFHSICLTIISDPINVNVITGIPRVNVDGILLTVYSNAVSYTHLRAHETPEHLVCRLLLEKKKNNRIAR